MRLVTGNGTLILYGNGVMTVTSPEYKEEVTTITREFDNDSAEVLVRAFYTKHETERHILELSHPISYALRTLDDDEKDVTLRLALAKGRLRGVT